MRIFVWSYLFTQYGYGDNQDGQQGVRSYPITNIFSGYYLWYIGRLYDQNVDMQAWSLTVADSGASYSFAMWSTAVLAAEPANKLRGVTIRCSMLIC